MLWVLKVTIHRIDKIEEHNKYKTIQEKKPNWYAQPFYYSLTILICLWIEGLEEINLTMNK